jgi:PAS domain S-box-containing protein
MAVTTVRILIVEDELVVASNLRDRLVILGYEVPAVVLSGEEVLRLAGETRPDLVLMDIKLRGKMDGIATAEELRARFDIPIVYLTGYADDGTLERAKITEPYGYVLKPFEIRELHSTIEMALYKHAMEKRLRESERKYRSLVENSLLGIMIVRGSPPQVLFANTPCAEMSGYTVEELLALSPEEALALLHPQDRPLLLERLSDHLLGRQVPASGEFRVFRKGGDLRWVEYSASLIEYDGQSAVQAGFRDITERRQTQEALQKAHDQLESRVVERTAELAKTNVLLREEIAHRVEVEEMLQRHVEELDILNDVGKKVGASLLLPQVVDAALQAIAGGIQSDLVVLYLKSEDDLILRGVCPPTPAPEKNASLQRVSRCFCGLAVSKGQPVYASNIHAGALCPPEDCVACGMHAFAALPLRKGDQIQGVLGLGSAMQRDFGHQAAFLEALAGQLAIGLDNTLLYAEVQHRAAELEQEVAERRRAEEELRRQTQELARANRLISALSQVSAHIQTTLDADEVLATLGGALQALGMTCAVALFEPEREALSIQYTSLAPAALHAVEKLVGLRQSDARISCVTWPAREVVEHRRAVYLPDAPSAFVPLVPIIPEDLLREAILLVGLLPNNPAICLPLATEELVVGALVVWGADLHEADVPALWVVATQVATAFERARLSKQVAEAEILREVDRLRSELIANVSHELRTPLGLIEVCCTSLLMDDVDFDEETERSFLVGIKEETNRLKIIVDNLLNLSQLESGRPRLDRQDVDLGALVHEVMETTKLQLAGQRLLHDFPSASLVASVDPRQIEQVVYNMLNNAIKYSPHGGSIRVEGRAGEGQVQICVSDEGIGIPAEEQERVFERFYRVRNELSQTVSGAGLGLAVCRGIVESHGGRIWVEQSSPAGTTFCFALPVRVEDA